VAADVEHEKQVRAPRVASRLSRHSPWASHHIISYRSIIFPYPMQPIGPSRHPAISAHPLLLSRMPSTLLSLLAQVADFANEGAYRLEQRALRTEQRMARLVEESRQRLAQRDAADQVLLLFAFCAEMRGELVVANCFCEAKRLSRKLDKQTHNKHANNKSPISNDSSARPPSPNIGPLNHLRL
jgi:hypothetical protein